MTAEVSPRSRIRANGQPDMPGIDRPDWMEAAACRTATPDTFYPVAVDDTAAAKRICLTCPVVDQCLNVALKRNEAHGVWGGLAPHEREQLVHGRPRRTAAYTDKQARRDQVRRLAERGVSDVDIAATLGCTPGAVSSLRARNGIPCGSTTGRSMSRREVRGHGKKRAS